MHLWAPAESDHRCTDITVLRTHPFKSRVFLPVKNVLVLLYSRPSYNKYLHPEQGWVKILGSAFGGGGKATALFSDLSMEGFCQRWIRGMWPMEESKEQLWKPTGRCFVRSITGIRQPAISSNTPYNAIWVRCQDYGR